VNYKNSNSLGYFGKYYRFKNNNNAIFSEDINELIMNGDGIDIVSIIEIINKGFCFADRTLVDKIKFTPWMAKDYKNGIWKYHCLPKHDTLIKKKQDIIKKFFKLVQDEIFNYVIGKKNIGILLSGGMDSRIVALALKKLQDDGLEINVTGITWGISNSRDVVYAEKIANLFNWNWKFFELNSSVLYDNIYTTALNGALYSPIHLHAMNDVSKIKDIDCILAGSFGDSVGRAEFSGAHLLELKSLSTNIFNRFKILNERVYKNYRKPRSKAYYSRR